MTTVQERHLADQDDSDRFARARAEKGSWNPAYVGTHCDNEPPPGEGWVPSGTCGGRWSRVHAGIFETWQPQPVPGVTIAGGGAIYTTTPSDALLAVANSEIAALTAEIDRLRAEVERLTYDRNHPYGEVAPTEPAWHSSTSQCVRCLHPGEFAS